LHIFDRKRNGNHLAERESDDFVTFFFWLAVITTARAADYCPKNWCQQLNNSNILDGAIKAPLIARHRRAQQRFSVFTFCTSMSMTRLSLVSRYSHTSDQSPRTCSNIWPGKTEKNLLELLHFGGKEEVFGAAWRQVASAPFKRLRAKFTLAWAGLGWL
jgi:hypothetical protein